MALTPSSTTMAGPLPRVVDPARHPAPYFNPKSPMTGPDPLRAAEPYRSIDVYRRAVR